MRDEYPMRTARRKTQRQHSESIGAAAPLCILCIEDHHTAGRKHDRELTAPLCKKHHREIHEQVRRGDISLSFEHDTNKRLAKALSQLSQTITGGVTSGHSLTLHY